MMYQVEKHYMLRKIRCWMGWHSPSRLWILVQHDGYKGIANEYKCPWCGYVGMVDSQGNLF